MTKVVKNGIFDTFDILVFGGGHLYVQIVIKMAIC
jgi:hypothetical protein